MSNLRQAAQQALEALETCDAAHISDGGRQWYDDKAVEEAITALRAALAEPVQEPVAKVELMTTGGNAGLATRIVEIDDHLRERLRPGQLLYTTPPQRLPLTEEEIAAVTDEHWPDFVAFARAIERAHGITP